MKLRITLSGCDDSTVVEIQCLHEHKVFLQILSEKINEKSTYSCMPRMYVEELTMQE